MRGCETPSPSASPVYLLVTEENTAVIILKDLEGTLSWSVLLTLLLVLAGFFALPVLLGVVAIYVATRWRASQ